VSAADETLGSVMTSIEDRAELALRQMLGSEASFRPGQLESIEAVAEARERVLLVQRTGWGKSAV
jgi:ATP-dependent DNA helicase RecQ